MTITAAPPVRRTAVFGLCAAAAAMTAAMAVAGVASTIAAGDAVDGRWAGLPNTAGIVGTGIGAALLPRVLTRRGRRAGLRAAYGLALAGALVAAGASAARHPAVVLCGLLAGLLLLGA